MADNRIAQAGPTSVAVTPPNNSRYAYDIARFDAYYMAILTGVAMAKGAKLSRTMVEDAMVSARLAIGEADKQGR